MMVTLAHFTPFIGSSSGITIVTSGSPVEEEGAAGTWVAVGLGVGGIGTVVGTVVGVAGATPEQAALNTTRHTNTPGQRE